MAFYHGVRTRQQATSISTPVEAGSGIPFIVGTAPVQALGADERGGKTNELILAYSYAEAVKQLGYSDDWEKYTLCELMYSHFKLFGVAPVIFVNVLNPATHRETVAEAAKTINENRQIILPLEALDDTVTVKDSTGETTYVAGDDYEVFYGDEKLIIEIVDDGAIAAATTTLLISYAQVRPAMITTQEIEGGVDVNTHAVSGFELIDQCFPKFGITPDILLAPKFSSNSGIAAIMSAKAEAINGLFEAKALIDVADSVTYYSDVYAWKKSNNIFSKYQVLCWPKLSLDNRIFHMSTQMASLMASVDSNNGSCPVESPSNKSLQCDATVLGNADHTEVHLDLQQANYLNSIGVVTAMNWTSGFVLWGNNTACYPANTDVKDYFICVSRMFAWVANSVVLTYWSKVDKVFNRRFIDSIVDSVNIWLNGMVSEEKLLGGRVEFREEDNSLVSLMSGVAVFHIYLTPPSPAQELEFVLEYDTDYVTAALL